MTDGGVAPESLPGGTPGPTPASDHARVYAVVDDALALIGPGAGDGFPPSVTESITQALLDLRELTGRSIDINTWLAETLDLGSAELVTGGAGPALAHLLRDNGQGRIDPAFDVPEMSDDEDEQDRREQQTAADAYAEIPDDLAKEPGSS